MMYKTSKLCFIFLLLFITNKFYSQVYINWKLDSKGENAEITIFNNSNEDIAIPIDTLSFQAYFNDTHKITKENWNKNYPFFALTLNVYDYNQNRLKANTDMPYLDSSEFIKTKNKIDSIQNKYTSIIKEWKINNNITNDNIAQINYYLLKNLILIKSKDKVKFSVIFNLRNISNKENGLYDSYIIEKDKKYSALLKLNIDKRTYNYLTREQKQKLKNYNLFTGRIESNKIEIRY